MIIRDKQELRRCVKQAVRRAEVVETRLNFDVRDGEMGVHRLLEALQSPGETAGRAQGTPLTGGAVEALAALDALDLPTHDPEKAKAIQQGYDRESYLAQVLRAMRARRVLVSIPMERAEAAAFADERFAPLLVVEESAFAPGRYGTDYEAAARRIASAARACGAMDVTLDGFNEQALRYCLAPLCEDECLVLHARLQSGDQVTCLGEVMDEHPNLRVLAHGSAERELIAASAGRESLLVRLENPARLGEALSVLGTRLLAFSAQAALPEQMLGRWMRAKEALWQALLEAYLPLARAGFELTAEALEADAQRLLGGAYLELHTIAQSD